VIVVNTYLLKDLFLEKKIEGLGMFENFISSEILEVNRNLEFQISSIYLNTNYLKKFQEIYPKYKLSKGEWIILTKLNDLIIKILEQSLIDYYHPKLNIALKVGQLDFDWRDIYLQVYTKEKSFKEYFKRTKYLIFMKFDRERAIRYIESQKTLQKYSNKRAGMNKVNMKYSKPIISVAEQDNYVEHLYGCFTLRELETRHDLNKDEVLDNLNNFHYYGGKCILRQPLKIVEKIEND
jgi:hypothetical protein